MRRPLTMIFLGALLSAPAWSCSICRCGDPTFNALGLDGVTRAGLRLALDWEQVEKTQGLPGGDFASLRERRTTLLLAYGAGERLSFFARLPYSQRDLTEDVLLAAAGRGDPEIYAQARLWSSPFDGAVGARASLFAIAGVKTAWGENKISRDGARLDEHVQPGTGSTDWFGGLSGLYQLNPRSALFASAQYRHTGRNDFDYRYGRIVLLNLAYERKLAAKWDAVLEANYRNAGRDEFSEVHNHGGVAHLHSGIDPDTGGAIAYFTPRLLFDAGGGWVLRASGQIPLSQSSLNGQQHEKTVVNLGVTRLFANR